MNDIKHRITCGCGWSYSTNVEPHGTTYCRNQYVDHLRDCPALSDKPKFDFTPDPDAWEKLEKANPGSSDFHH